MRFVVDSTRTSGSRRSLKAAITLLLLGLTAIAATYAKNALPRLWLNTRIMIGLGCLEAKARANGREYAKIGQNRRLSSHNRRRSTFPRLRAGIRPSFAPTTPATGPIGAFLHYEGNQWT